MSDFKGTAPMLNTLPRAKELLGEKGYHADWFRQALTERGITACVPSRSNRKTQIPHDRVLYRQRHRIENRQVGSKSQSFFCIANPTPKRVWCSPTSSKPHAE
jgi:transposase